VVGGSSREGSGEGQLQERVDQRREKMESLLGTTNNIVMPIEILNTLSNPTTQSYS
jgi:hypothetical protein